ncbi:MAG: NAD(+)/NADH kinase [Acidimicrobiia bacterium]
MSDVPCIALIPNPERDHALDIAKRIVELIGDRAEVRLLEEDAAAVGRPDLGVPSSGFVTGVDVAFAIGGDGTMLRTVDLMLPTGAAVLGVHAGRLGYLTEVEPDALTTAIDKVLVGDFQIEARTVLDVTIERGGVTERVSALNELVLEKVHAGRLVGLAVDINGRPFTTYRADGVIVATPTGSTAYSFSVRGPIVSPRMSCLVFTPISPHMLFDRSLVLGVDEVVRFEVLDGPPVACTLDGREFGELTAGDVVVCRAGDKSARLVTFGGRDFHQVLAEKFSLGAGDGRGGDD